VKSGKPTTDGSNKKVAAITGANMRGENAIVIQRLGILNQKKKGRLKKKTKPVEIYCSRF